jgi:dUTP pyrophosphatase
MKSIRKDALGFFKSEDVYNALKRERGFEVVKDDMRRTNGDITLPTRSDNRSAGYDFYSKEEKVLMPGEFHTFWTDVKAQMFYDNVLKLYPRSGNGCRKGLVLRNGTGIIDPSYYSNVSNDGNIGICLVNTGTETVFIAEGDRIAQGVFNRYLITDDDRFLKGKEKSVERTGGFGSSGN